MNDVKPKGEIAFFYTDGGARPLNPGFAGTGIHGYVITSPVEKPMVLADHFHAFKNTKTESGNVAVPKFTITDRGYTPCDKDGVVRNGAKWVKPDFFVDAVISFELLQTNNFAELYGIYQSFKIALEVEGLKQLYILADSQYAINCVFAFGDNWRSNGWVTKAGEVPANCELVKLALEARDALKATGVKISVIKVKGHSDDVGNNSADYLATIGCHASTYGEYKHDIRWSIGRRYWDGEVDRHPMLHGRRFIYNRKVADVDTKEIFMVEPGNTDLTIGKRDHEGYAVIRLNTPCEAYSNLLKAQARYNQDENWPMVVKTDRLYSKFVQKNLGAYGPNCLVPNQRGAGLFFLDGGAVSNEHNPPLLIYRTLEAFTALTERLEEYLVNTGLYDQLDFPEDYHGITGIDLTDHFYDTVEKKVGKDVILKKVLRSEIEVGYTKHIINVDLTVNGNTVQRTLPLTLGMDMPPRNSLKKLETEDPRITLITWRAAPGSFQYACVVECISGVGIWSNFYCDRFFV